ncbi:YciI family protein [Ideonella sp. BN130291]|uniref:YciI family protein n=1 Tax=Ideonella sp. BN130291 TaxID=3112940 RepID=UPI002E260D1E|nr:YciI family protein [Ideonella sp. BN130291]
MEYLLLIHAEEAEGNTLSPGEMAERMAAYGAYTEALAKAGVMRGANRLRSADTGTTVRLRSGKTEVLNGPYAETREQLGGYYLIDVPDLDTALAWAARCPGASHGTMEVRPIWPVVR